MPAAGASDSVPPLRGGYVGGHKQMNIKESEFEWLRGYLQRDLESSLSVLPELNEDTESDSGTESEREAGAGGGRSP